MQDKKMASDAAMADCLTKGGAVCTIKMTYDNQCAAMVVGASSMYVINGDPDLDVAIQKGMTDCKARTTGCEVYYTDCSLPTLVQ